MRLYLSSFRMGRCSERLRYLVGDGRRAVVIANATDVYPWSDRAAGVRRELDALEALGFDATELDLRDYFYGQPIVDELRGHDVVWVRGGDVFTLRHSLSKSGADVALVRLLELDEIAYGGYSAGICVLAPTVRGLEAVDDPAWLRTLYGVDPIWEGLSVLDYCIVPHVSSPDHPESAACDRVAASYRTSRTAHRTLGGGDVLVIDGDTEHLCSLDE